MASLFNTTCRAVLLLASVSALTACEGLQQTGAGAGTATVPPVELSKLPAEVYLKNGHNQQADIAKRLLVLEESVRSLEKKFDTAKPAIEKMEAAERQFRALSLELDRITKAYNLDDDVAAVATAKPEIVPESVPVLAPVPTVKPVQKQNADHKFMKPIVSPQDKVTPAQKKNDKAVKTPVSSVPVSSVPVSSGSVSGPAVIQDVRLGSQGDHKVRVVVDLSSKAAFSYDLDEVEKILVLDVKGANAKAAIEKSGLNSSLVDSYVVQNDGPDARVVLQLKDRVKVTGSNVLAPSSGVGHRLYVDLAQ